MEHYIRELCICGVNGAILLEIVTAVTLSPEFGFDELLLK
jgi:hypothetical protein